MKTFNLISNITNGAGLQQDAEILRRLLESAGHRVTLTMFTRNPTREERHDVNIFMELLAVQWLDSAGENWFMPNSEWYHSIWDRFLPRLDRILCKTQDCYRIWSKKVGAEKCIFTGFESRDSFDPAVKRKPVFLHLAGKSTTKNTEAVAAAWRQFRIPHQLVVTANDPRINPLCQNIPNVKVITRLTESDLIQKLNGCLFHVMPSAYEGWGHVLHEALGCGAIVITSNAPPMCEFPGIARALLVPVANAVPMRAALANLVDPVGVFNSVTQAAALSETEIAELSRCARESFLDARTLFRQTFLDLADRAPHSVVQQAIRKPRLTLSMIVKNGEKDLAHCLESVRGIVDEIVIADTGSTDGSIEVAKRYGARVINLPWQDDFAAARNACLAEVDSDWVLVLDADEQLDQEAGAQINAAIGRCEADAYLVGIRNYVNSPQQTQPVLANDGKLHRADCFPAYLSDESVRLFRNKPEIHFTGCVHETVGRRVETLGYTMGRAGFIIHHFGFTSSQQMAKHEYYRSLDRKKIEEQPNNWHVFFELGLKEYNLFHNDEEALRLLTRACELNGQIAVSWVFRGMALSRLGRHEEAVICFQRSRKAGDSDECCWEAEGDANYNISRFAEARRCFQQAFKLAENPLIQSKLGMTEVRLGHIEPGLKKMEAAISKVKSAELYDRLISGLVFLGRIAAAAEVSEDKLANTETSVSSFLRCAALWKHAGQPERALMAVLAGLKVFPRASVLQETQLELTPFLLPNTTGASTFQDSPPSSC